MWPSQSSEMNPIEMLWHYFKKVFHARKPNVAELQPFCKEEWAKIVFVWRYIMKTLVWPSKSPDLNLIEMLWRDFKKVAHAQKLSNVAEFQQFCKEEWAKTVFV